ncbi:MAG: hypothetical protein ACXWRE_01395 [Pseudobdellovibrionaceae bacterium]
MCKKFVSGMMVALTVMSFNAHAAVEKEAKARPMSEVIKEYVDKVKAAAKTTAADASKQPGAAKQMDHDVLLSQLGLSARDKTSIRNYFNNKKGEIADALAAAVAAKQMTTGKDVTPEAAASLNTASDAYVSLLRVADLIGSNANSTFLKPAETQDASAALTKLVHGPKQFLSFEAKQRDSFSKVITKTVELTDKGERIEDALVKAIMEVQGISKEAAMELVKKVKELC